MPHPHPTKFEKFEIQHPNLLATIIVILFLLVVGIPTGIVAAYAEVDQKKGCTNCGCEAAK
jgi:hypothetical protein